MNGVSIIVGSIIGSGIFVSPTGIFKEVNSIGASLLVWVLCGVYSFFGAYSYYAELGTMIQRSGADYAYVLVAFGPFMAFLRMWCEILVMRAFALRPSIALTFAKYILEPFFNRLPGADHHREEHPRLHLDSGHLHLGKTLALIIIIIAGCVQVGREAKSSSSRRAVRATRDGRRQPRACLLPTGLCLFAYNDEEPRSATCPWQSSSSACAIVTVVYVLANAAYFTTVPVAEFVTTPAVAILFAKKISGFLAAVMPIFVSLSTFGGVNGVLLTTTSRIFFVAAEEDATPASGMIQQRLLTPRYPLCCWWDLISLVYLTIDDIYVLVNYMGFVNWLAIGLSVSIVLYLRVKRPNDPRPIRVPIIFPIVYTMFTVLLCAMGVVIILTAVPVYLIGVAWTNKPKSLLRWTSDLTRLVQKVFLVQLQEDGGAKSEAEKLVAAEEKEA
uniref:AA_permease domain-containing protein n=1 Tax=Macrostomum lignano TaxID=282301 RepID=A0A1I8FAL0_9PLAT